MIGVHAADATSISWFLMPEHEDRLRVIRERIADQHAVIELLELRGYEMMLPAARGFLAALEMARRNAQTRLDADRRRPGIR
jgi:hypothetical protein